LNGIFGNVDLLDYYLNKIEHILQKQRALDEDANLNSENSIDYLVKQISLSSKSVGTCMEHQKCMTDDVLQFSNMRTNKISITNTYYSPYVLLRTIIQTYRAQAEQKVSYHSVCLFVAYIYLKGIFLEVDVQGVDKFTRLKGDTIRLNQILTNLLSNAIKFTHTGGITITFSVTDTSQ
jgi:signal transduction histidine kinase